MTEVKIESIDGSTSWSDGVPLYIGSSATNNANRTLLLEVRRYGGVFGGQRGEDIIWGIFGVERGVYGVYIGVCMRYIRMLRTHISINTHT